MQEDQNIEYKETWRDEYLKWICGFANARGGVIYIGKDDNGRAVGVANAKKLMEDIPNKVRDILGIMVDVNLICEDGKDVVEVVTAPYPTPISYKGQYHFRSGSTKQELKGAALDRFLLAKSGRTWDSAPVARLEVDELSDAMKRFRKLAIRSGRFVPDEVDDTDQVLLERLRLVDEETGKLKRAAAILFYPDPERFVAGAYVKIGFFRTNADLVYQDEVGGDLFTQIYKTMDLLTTKYLRAMITYEGIQRIERFPVPPSAIRETVLNALAHKDYASGVPVQIRVYSDKLQIWNCAELPQGWTVEKLKGNHSSRPYNPAIARVLFRSGEIEQWGRGINNVMAACKQAGVNEPEYEFDGSGLEVRFNFTDEYKERISEPQSEPQKADDGTQSGTQKADDGTQSGTQKAEDGTQNDSAKLFSTILRLVKENPNISGAEMAKETKVSMRTIRRTLSQMKDKVRYVGSSKNGHWVLIEQ